jgi:hypothetical protein
MKNSWCSHVYVPTSIIINALQIILHSTPINFHDQKIRKILTSVSNINYIIVVYLTSLCVNFTFFGMTGPRVPKKAKFTHERVEYNVFLFDEPLKGSKSLKIFKISLAFCFDKLWHLSKSVHTGGNSQILTVSNKKRDFKMIYLEIILTNISLIMRTMWCHEIFFK